MLDWIQNFASDLDNTIKVVIGVVAVIVALWLCHKGGWAFARIVISIISVVVLLAAINNLNLFASRAETDMKRGGAPVTVVVNPHEQSLVDQGDV